MEYMTDRSVEEAIFVSAFFSARVRLIIYFEVARGLQGTKPTAVWNFPKALNLKITNDSAVALLVISGIHRITNRPTRALEALAFPFSVPSSTHFRSQSKPKCGEHRATLKQMAYLGQP